MPDQRIAFRPLITFVLVALVAAGAVAVVPSFVQAQEATPRVYLPLLLKPPTVYVLANHTHVDKGNELLIYGEVQNGSGDILTLVRVNASFYDVNGQLVGSKHSYVRLDDLPPGDRSCFRIWVYTSDPYPTNWSTYRLSTSTYWPDGTPPPALTVVSHTGAYYAGDTSYRLSGVIRNDEGVTLRALQVVATEYDSQKRVLNCDTYEPASTTTLAPNQTRSFLMLSFGSHLAGVTSYRLQTNAVRQP